MSVQLEPTSSLTLRELLERRRPSVPEKGGGEGGATACMGISTRSAAQKPPSEGQIRAAATKAVEQFSWEALAPHLERPFEAVVRFCRAVTRRRSGAPKWAIQEFVRRQMESVFAAGEAAGRGALEVAEAAIWRIVVLLDQMLASGRKIRKKDFEADGRSVVCATVPGYPGVRLFIVLRVDAPRQTSVCAIRTPGEFNRDQRHSRERRMNPYQRPSPGSLNRSLA